MAAKAKEETKQKKNVEGLSSIELLKSLLSEEDADHFQDRVVSEHYVVSTGSLKFNRKLDGGLPPGMHRFCGITEGGKSSAALEIIKNFLLEPNRKAFYVDAEGRLHPGVQNRSGVKLVFKEDDWLEGTCFVFKDNIFETVGRYIRTLVENNTEKLTYAFVVDSMDSLIKKDDLEKELDESDKIAAAATMTSSLFKRINLPICTDGHLCILISQVRSTVPQQHAPRPAARLGNFSGGNAALHYANYIFEFLELYLDDKIWENPNNKSDRGKQLGHNVKIRIAKSQNETTGDIFDYPIKRGRQGGNSIWKEREIVDELVLRGMLIKNSTWYKLVDFMQQELKQHGIEDVKDQLQGLAKWYEYIEGRPDITDYLYHYLSNN